MGHKINGVDARAAFVEYRELTGDTTATLLNDGAFWTLRGRRCFLEGYGAGTITNLIRAWIAGWKSRQAMPHLEE